MNSLCFLSVSTRVARFELAEACLQYTNKSFFLLVCTTNRESFCGKLWLQKTFRATKVLLPHLEKVHEFLYSLNITSSVKDLSQDNIINEKHSLEGPRVQTKSKGSQAVRGTTGLFLKHMLENGF